MKNSSFEQKRQRSIDRLTNFSWDYAHLILYKDFQFSSEEQERAKTQIRKLYEEILPELYNKYALDKLNEFIMRVNLTCAYLKRNPQRYITHPAHWFNPENKYGFTVTRKWFLDRIESNRYKSQRFYLKNEKVERVIIL